MGDKITPVSNPELLRAKFLQEALERGTPLLHREVGSAASIAAPQAGGELPSNYLKQLIECAPEAVSILDLHRRIILINGEYTRMFGYSSEEAVGSSVDELIVPPDRLSEARWLREVQARGQKVSLETKRCQKDGTTLDMFVSTAPVMVEQTHVATYVLYRDISAQKRAEALSSALYRIAERTSATKDLQQFYAAIHAIVSELVPAQNFYIALYDARSGLLSFPYYVDEKADVSRSQEPTEYVLRTGEPLLCTAEVLRMLTEQGEVKVTATPFGDWIGVPLKLGDETFGVVAVQSHSPEVRFHENDKAILTFVAHQLASAIQYKRKEEALRLSEARYRSLIDSAVHGIYRSNLEGRFLDANPALIAMLGYDFVEEVLALDPKHDVFFEPTEQARLMRQFKPGVRLTNVEVRWKHRDGHAVTVRLSGRAVNDSEKGERVVEVIAEDVTERRVLEDQFRQAQKMEAVGRLAAGVAHDFNNLLTVIRGHTEVLQESAAPNSSMQSKIEAIQLAANRATSLTRQLLAFSRKQLLELKVLDLNVIVIELEQLLRPLIGENIELQTRLASDLCRTRADAGQIEQVIVNLVVNSRDAMPDGGRIAIETVNVDLNEDIRRKHSYVHPGPYVMLSVRDNGQGMDRETQSRIFEPFFTTKPEGKGTGLGLSTVYGIIKQSRGYIFVESELGRGTTFRIYLPRLEEVAETGVVLPSQSASGGSETLLLVEDEESVRQLVLDTLLLRGYKVLEADHGASALRIAATHPGHISLLIADVVLPGMSGREVSKQLSVLRPDIKVLYLSGYTEDVIVHQGVLEPGAAFLQKPFTLQSLLRKVREVLSMTPSSVIGAS